MIKIGICDDGKNVCAEIENTILSYAKAKNIQIEILAWYSGESFCEYLKQGKEVDILFLDIEMFELSGLEVGSYIRKTLDNREMQIVYIFSHTSYAQQLFKTQPLDFLEKPVMEADIIEVLELGMKILRRRSEKFKFQCGKELYQIAYGEIIFFFSSGRKINIVTTKGEYTFYGKLKEIQRELPPEFLVIHQSYIVNKEHISRYAYEYVETDNNMKLTISQKYRKQVRESLLKED